MASAANFGCELKTRDYSGFILSLTKYSPNHVIDFHHHEVPYFSLSVGGGYSEKNEFRTLDVTCGDLVIRPAGYLHYNQFSNRDNYSFKIEPLPQQAENLRDLFKELSDLRIMKSAGLKAFRLLHAFANDEEILKVESLILELISDCVTKKELVRRSSRLDLDWIHTVKDYINLNYNRSITLQELSEVAHVSAIYMIRAFKASQGRTIGDFQRQIKVKRALSSILNSRSSLTVIAHESGFYDLSHLTHEIFRYTGITPLKIRKSAWKFI